MTARIPPTEITGVKGTLMKRMATRMLGRVPESLGVLWHHPKLLMLNANAGRKLKDLDACDPQLKAFAHLAVAALVGCSWCLDFNYYEAHHAGLDLDKARAIPRWRDASVFTPLERDVLAYAEAMSHTPPTVDDELSGRLLGALGAPALLELTAMVAFANLTTRSNVALGIESDGLAASCGLEPLTVPAADGAVASTP